MNHPSEAFQGAYSYNEYNSFSSEKEARPPFDELMSREELATLTGTKQPKRMCAWLEARSWAHEPPSRRGDIPKVLRTYRDARLSGLRPERMKKANYSFMTAGGL